MRLNQLRDFVAVARTGSLRAAARDLGLAQPAITRSIRELEHSLGAQLFIREARGARLTPIGERMLPRASAILRDVQRTRDEVRQLSGEAEGELVVGLSIAGHMGVLGNVLDPFMRRWPGVRLRLIEGFLPTLAADIAAGFVDLYIGPVADPAGFPTLTFEKLFDNERMVIGRIGHPLSSARSLAELSGAAWLTTSITQDAGEELDDVFAERGLPPPNRVCQCQSALSILTVLASSDILAMAPRQWVESRVTHGLIGPIPLLERFPAPPIMLVQRVGLGPIPAAEHFVHLIRRALSPAAQGR